MDVNDKCICDICGTEYDYTKPDDFEIQEFVHIDTVGGYGSIFGDGTRIVSDICQKCLEEKLGKYLRKEVVDYNEE